MKKTYRIGQIVPSSNVTMETEIPAIFREREKHFPESFTFHSARMRMKQVTVKELASMDALSDKCAEELSDAAVDVMGYACLVAIMAMGKGYHCIAQERLHKLTHNNGHPAPVVTSAGALVEGLAVIGAKKVALVTPYMKPLTQKVSDYIEDQGFAVLDSVSLEISDNLQVAVQDPMNLLQHYKKLKLNNVDTLILSACVQMPSLAAVQKVETECGIQTVTASVCTAYQMMKELGLKAEVPNCGALLSGKY